MSEQTPNNNPSTMGDYGYEGISKHSHKIFKYEKRILKENDPENLHQIRVAMRRLRSVLLSFNSAFKFPQIICDRTIGKIAQKLGLERDADIININLETKFKPNLPKEENKILEEINHKFNEEKIDNFPSSKEILSGKKYLKLKQALLDWLNKPEFTEIGLLKIERLLPDLLLPQISVFSLQSAWLIGTELGENKEIKLLTNLTEQEIKTLLDEKGKYLHTLRKQAKKVRYQLELFTNFYPPKYIEYIDFVKELQTVLGNIQDNLCLLDYLHNLVGNKWEKKLPELAELIKQDQERQWREWQHLQGIFLSPNYLSQWRENIIKFYKTLQINGE